MLDHVVGLEAALATLVGELGGVVSSLRIVGGKCLDDAGLAFFGG